MPACEDKIYMESSLADVQVVLRMTLLLLHLRARLLSPVATRPSLFSMLEPVVHMRMQLETRWDQIKWRNTKARQDLSMA